MEKPTILIRNRFYTKSEIFRAVTTTVLAMVYEYEKNPNCWADLWIKGEGLSEQEQVSFIAIANKLVCF